MELHERLTLHRDQLLAIAARYGARNVRVFGSVARREESEESDIDLLVDLEPGRTPFDLGGLVHDLMELLGCPVDVVTDGGLQGRFREQVQQDATALETMRVSSAFRDANPLLPGGQMVDLLNVLVHGYFAIENDAVWGAVE